MKSMRMAGTANILLAFDGRNMSVEISIVTWDSQGPISTGNYQYEIESWFYTEKGWFSYVLDVPEAAGGIGGDSG